MQKIPSHKSGNRWGIRVAVGSYADMAKKCRKKFQKNLTKNRRSGILPSRATRMPFTSHRASFLGEPVHLMLSWFEPYGHRVILHGRECRRIVGTPYHKEVLYHDISDGCTGAGASVRVTSGKLGANMNDGVRRVSRRKVSAKEEGHEGHHQVVSGAGCGSGWFGVCGGGVWGACRVGGVLGCGTVCHFPCLVRWGEEKRKTRKENENERTVVEGRA